MNKELTRCSWCLTHEIYLKYHDEEWGAPVHDEIKHFEFLLLETMQAGLSWLTILKKRENYRQAFAGFDPSIVATFDEKKVDQLMQNSGIIRNRKKIEAAINNAQKFLQVQKEYGSFDKFIWQFTNRKTIKNSPKSIADIPAKSPLSETVSKELKKLGFTFVGSITIHSHLQATGIINDHTADCFRSNT